MRDWTIIEGTEGFEVSFNTPKGVKAGNKFLYKGEVSIPACGAVFEKSSLFRLFKFAKAEDLTVEA